MLSLKTILHPTDFSEQAGCAFQLACSLARTHGSRLILLHVISPPMFHSEVVARRQDNGYYDEMYELLCRIKPADPAIPVEYLLEEGQTADSIADVASRQGCDLIVLGTHGRTGLGRLLMGSVAEQVMRKAPCPVLTVKTPLSEAVTDEQAEAVAAK